LPPDGIPGVTGGMPQLIEQRYVGLRRRLLIRGGNLEKIQSLFAIGPGKTLQLIY